ncbi:hypothetical protein JA33_311 [Dickeya phage vB_DsoM_JA33]|uniref:Uncharacterized protein n=3 Tax=Salmondvirus JA11 TaxID=2734141 RepID=A0A384ZWV4_9CAUD|nr:hypothetical protein HOU32_gp310 [Dickeya phage vB_DsoM_JA11]AXG66716.1 hypothetical protein JA13_313 [Dickeya phage vB_DsoM_JA13]AXG67685.1 hypothetical protein JA33_311 [Dickeya phage vB_DsoM_JA33]AYD80115.1 hypothetical protein JA11_310 [Dickeya phage vB_DsoM_JA11]
MAKSKSTSLVPKRIERITKKAGAIAQVKSKQTDLAHDIEISTRGAHEVSGFVIEVTADDSVTIRHKKGAGSSKQIVSTFTKNQIISFIGEAGGMGQLLVDAYMVVQVIRGQTVKVKDDVIIATDIQTGEVTRIATNIPGYDVRAIVDEAVASKKYGTPIAVEKKKGAGKVEKIAKGGKDKSGKKKKKSDENF